LDVGNPRAFIAGAVLIFSHYPAEVWDDVINPARGLPSRTARPSLADIKAACEEIYEPRARQITRERARAFRENEAERERAALERLKQQGEKRRAAEKAELAELKMLPAIAIGVPSLGYAREVYDGKHAQRVEEELAARRARRLQEPTP
jgi:type II secretory pathway component HofQ